MSDIGNTNKTPHKNHRQRVYNRYLNSGIESFAPHEVLELLLFYPIPRRDVNPLAHELIAHFGSLAGVLDAHPEDLKKINGMTERAAVFLSMQPEVMRIYNQQKSLSKKSLNNSANVMEYASDLFFGRSREVFYLLCLDSKCRLIQTVQIGQGDIAAISVLPRDIVESALRYNSAQVIFAHNHPSGSVDPSNDDYVFTRRMAVAFSTIDIPVLDHVVVNETSAYSFARNGRMDTIKNEVKIRIAAQYEQYSP